MASCSQKTNYATDEPFIIATYSPAGPDEYRYSHHCAIDASGRLRLYTKPNKRLRIGEDAPVHEVQLSKKEVEQIQRVIEKNTFWRLKEDLSTESLDGAYHFVTVNLTNESKEVGGLNPDHPKFREIEDAVFDLINEDDYRRWNKDISEHIYEMNPD